jgi:hypothetical protein
MFDRLRFFFFFIISCALAGWIGHKMFRYFTHATPPVFELKGITQNGTYARTVNAAVTADTAYKVASVKINLDGKEIMKERVKARQFEAPFSIDTLALTDGQHTLDVETVDSSYHRNITTAKYTFFIDNTPLRVAFLDAEYVVDQGKTAHLRIQSNKKLARAEMKIFASTYLFYPESDESTLYECFIPVSCEERPFEHLVTVDIQDVVGDKAQLTTKVTVKAFEFKKQHGFTVQESKLSQEKELSMSMKVLDEALDKWVKESPRKKGWSGPFEYPISVQRTSTPFGEIRMTAERGRYMHKGIDLINRPKCVVWAAQDGKVIIKDRFFLTGNTVVLDHGLGVFTLYAHLEEFADLEVGDSLKKGNPVGKLGMTGYATGYHLHWELRVNNMPVDPTEWTSKVY